jgi:hypothetical protein
MQRSICLAVTIAVATGCDVSAHVRVRDPRRVTVSVEDLEAGPVQLSGNDAHVEANVGAPLWHPGRGSHGPPGPQRVVLRRELDGAVSVDAPDTWGHTHDIVVDAEGSVCARSPWLTGEALGWDGDDLRMRLAYTYAPRDSVGRMADRPFLTSFEIWMTTPRSNVAEIDRRRTPERGLGWLLLGMGVPFAVGSVASLEQKDPDVRLAGGIWLGAPALYLLGAGAFLLLLPEQIERERFSPALTRLGSKY